MLFDLSFVVNALSSHTVTIQRFNTDTYTNDGILNNPTSAGTFTTKASVQPASGGDIRRLTNADENSEYVCVWTPIELCLHDRVTVTGRGVFEVQHCEQWQDSGAYWKSTAKLVDETEV